MTKADKLRAAMRDASKEGITLAEVITIGGSPGSISNMLKTGEVVSDKSSGQRRYKINPDYTPVRQSKIERALPIKRTKKSKRAGGKKKHKAPRKAVRSMRDLADKFAAAAESANITVLALNNLIACAKNLAATVRREVEGVETNPNLIAAIENQERAAEIARAA